MDFIDLRLTKVFLATAVVAASAFMVGRRVGRRSAPGQISNGGNFGKMNSDTVGERFKKDLPRGDAPLQLYSLGTPNGQKVTMLLEELGVAYDAHFIAIQNEEQFGSGFVSICPNSKIPALVDLNGPGGKPINLFESVSIMIYLAEKFKSPLLPTDPRKRQECLNWLICQVGSAPYFGQYYHFTRYAPGAKDGDVIPYCVNRYETETKRLFSLLERQLACGSTDEGAPRDYLLGKDCSIADLAWMPWINAFGKVSSAEEKREWDIKYPFLWKWVERINSRPSAKLGMRVNGFSEPPEIQNYSKRV